MSTPISVINVKARHAKLEHLRDAFSNEPLDVRLSVSRNSGTTFYAFMPRGLVPYSHCTYPTAEALIKALGQRGGIGGVLTEERVLVCPYTGEPLHIEERKGGFRVMGGYNPYLPQPGPDQFAYFAGMRGGEPAAPDQEPNAPEVSVTDETEPPPAEIKVSEEAVDLAEQARDANHKAEAAPVTVSVPGGVPEKKAPVTVSVPGGVPEKKAPGKKNSSHKKKSAK